MLLQNRIAKGKSSRAADEMPFVRKEVTALRHMSDLGLGRVKTVCRKRSELGEVATRANFSALLCSDRGHQRLNADDVHDAGEIVGEYVQRHLGRHLRKTPHQEVCRPHPHLQSAEGMFDSLATLAHGQRVPVEAPLYGLQYMLMLPSRDPSLLASGAAVFDGAALTGIGPVSA